jgi:predicted transglutaminase-like cysteine proteinase
VNEYWTLPRTRGDCEDYALLKRHTLLEKGWPVSAVLMTVVRDEKGEGHAVLTARTVQGDFILDNKVERCGREPTPYQFVMPVPPQPARLGCPRHARRTPRPPPLGRRAEE